MPNTPLTYVSELDPRWKQQLMNVLELATGRQRMAARYERLQQMDLAPAQVWGKALELLEVGYRFSGLPLTEIPREGPLVIIANHPFGVVDGLIMGHLAATTRPAFSILVNAVLGGQDPRIEANLLPVDFAETKEAARINIATRQTALERLQRGEAIVIFPSGGVATAPRVFGQAEEFPWKRFTAQLIQKANATVLPVHFHGQNSFLFHLASKIGTAWRLGLLLREVRNKMGTTIEVTIGDPIPPSALASFSRDKIMEQLYALTMALGKASPR